jgi:hypothetical protein
LAAFLVLCEAGEQPAGAPAALTHRAIAFSLIA